MTEDAVNGTVYGVPLDGGPAITLATSQHDARFMAVDGANLYWADFNNGASGTIMRVPIGGGTPITISENQLGPLELAVDATSVYWTNQAGGMVMKATPK